MILTDDQIKESVKSGEIGFEPFDESQVEAASIDLRVGEFGATTKIKQKTNIKEKGFLLLAPGDFGVVECMEIIKFNN